MFYHEKEAMQDMTVDSLELIFRNGKIKKLRVDGPTPGTSPITKTNVDTKHEDINQRKHMTITPKVVTFQEENDKPKNSSLNPT